MQLLAEPTGDSARKAAPYIFFGETTSLCDECLALVPAKVLIEGDQVYYQKRCRAHGVQKALVSTDLRFFKWQQDFLKPGDRSLVYQGRTHYGCPYDCGLCPDHEQHSCLAIVEVNQHCNLECPVCFAGADRASAAGHRRAHARRTGRQRRRTRPGAIVRRRAHHPSRNPRHS